MSGKPGLRARFIETSKKALEDPTLSTDARLLHEAVVRSEGKVMNIMADAPEKKDVDPREWELPGLDIDALDIDALVPYQTELATEEVNGPARRACMNELVRGVIRLGRDQLPVVVALQSLKAAPAPKLSLIQVNDWVKGNVDDFSDRVDEAHSVFKGRMTAQLIMHADNPVLPKGLQRDTLALLAVNNAENPERYKRGVFVPNEPPGKGVAGKLAEVGKNAADERAERKVLSNGHKD